MKKVFILVLSLFSFIASAQEKAEREESIRSNEVHPQALDFINKAHFKKRVRWYREYGLENESLEAKVKFKRHWYSIEFDTQGNLEDIEMTVRKLPHDIQKVLKEQLNQRFRKSKILRIQLQWLHDPQSLLSFFNHAEKKYRNPDGYEMEVEGYADGDVNTYEVTTDAKGQVLSVLKYVTRPTDNLDF